ncbi:MAG: DNRLRE domain-containing protein [Planctomycetes bacterium]|nr:DNRLRE domain-containing protein [Planctomycetota bacterium]
MRGWLAFIVALSVHAGALAQFHSIGLTVRETAGVARRQEPVTTGVPIPLDAGVRGTDSLRVVAGDGREVSAQFRVLSRWYAAADDASAPIRWVLVDFQASLAANGEASFELRDDAPPGAIEHPIDITESPEFIDISTSIATFRITRGTMNLFDGVAIDTDSDGMLDDIVVANGGDGGIVVVREDGSRYVSSQDGAPSSVSIEERGPIRTVVRVDGRLHTQTQNGAYAGALDYLEYTARYHFYRGRSDVRLQLTLRNPDKVKSGDAHQGGSDVFHSFEELSLRLPARLGSSTRFETVGDGAISGALDAADRVLLYQDSSGGPNWGPASDGSPYWSTTFQGYRVTRGSAPQPPILDAGLRALGLGDVSDDRAGVAVSVRDFWQEFPKGIALGGSGAVDVQLYPGSWATSHRFRGGLQKTHDVLFQFHPGTAVDADVESVARAFQSPLHALASPQAYRDSKALGPISTPDPNAFRTYEESMSGILDYAGRSPLAQGDLYREIDDKDEYGWLNWGDHYREGEKNLRYWGNNEFDFSWILLLGWLRTPGHDDRFFELGRAAARHLVDVDLYHTDLDLFWANRGMRKHDASGVTDHSRDPNLSHFWVDGLVLYYWLTGDESARDGMHELQSWMRAREEDPVGHPGQLSYAGEVRSKGWMLSALVAFFECLGDRRDWDLAERMIPAEIATGTTNEGYMPNSIGLVDPWMHGYVTEALGRYCLVARAMHEPINRARELLVRILRFQATLAWSPARGMMAYTWDPVTREAISFSSNLSQTAVNGFAYASILTGGADFLAWARRCYDSYYDYRNYPYFYSTTLLTPAKNTAFRLRFGQVYMHLLQTTPPDSDGRPPRISNVRVDGVTWTSAIVRFETDEPADAQVVCTASGTPQVVANQRGFFLHSHTVRLHGLRPGTTYRFMVWSRDRAGDEAPPASGTLRTLDPDVTPPVIGRVTFAEVTGSSATLRFTTNEPSAGSVEWGPMSGGPPSTLDEPDGLRLDHEIVIALEPDTGYRLRVRAADRWDNVATSPETWFRSSVEGIVPASFDGHLVANYSGTRLNTHGPIEVRDNARLHYDGLLRFDLSTIPHGATLQAATLEIVKQGGNSVTVNVRAVRHNAESDHVSAPGGGFDPSDPCYLYRDLSAGVSWAPGGGGADDAMGDVAAEIAVDTRENRAYLADLTDLVRRWVDGTTPNEGLFLEVHGTGLYAMFRSSEDADPTARPHLHLTYRR